jgi:beta-glucanase (GH16 family)
MTVRRVLLTAGSAIVVVVAVLAAFMLRTDAAPMTSDGHPSSASDGMRLVFSDEFDTATLDDEAWHTCFWWAPTTCAIETHDDAGLYTASNVSVADGVLTLRARREQATGWNGTSYDYTSGMVSTGGSSYSTPRKKPGFTFTYGYAEARMQVPAGRGLVPAFWLPMADHAWPPEIDVMEMLGSDPGRTTMHYHYRRSNGTHADVGKGWNGPDFSAGWHTFGVDWEPGSIVWYVDGVERASFTDPCVTDQPAYLVLNLGVGGTWAGSPDESTALPADLAVDYVRVYQHPPA